MSININTQALINASDKLLAERNSLTGYLSSANSVLSDARSAWNSPAGTNFFTTYFKFSAKCDENIQILMNSYINFLRATSGQGYELLEKEIKKQASAFD